MGLLRTIALVVLGISFFVFVLFFGRLPALRRTPIATLHNLLFIRIPNGIVALDELVTGRRVTRALARFFDYMIHDRHPTVVIFFLALLAGGEYLYLPAAWPMMSTWHRVAGSIAVVLPYLFLYLSVMADPGYITPENHAYYMSLYPYDYSIFFPGQHCRTCGFLKPPRSKHCSICKRCVAKLDHHCIFINGCVGYGNQHWFILLLLSTAILTSYGALLGFSLLSDIITARYPSWSLWPPSHLTMTQYFAVWTRGLQDNVNMGAVSLLAALTSPLVWGLLAYTLWLIYCGTTTNESLKWSDCKDDMADGLVFKRRMSPDRPRDPRIESTWSRWPLDTQQILAYTDDGMPPRLAGPGEGPWDRVWTIKDVENLYDMGFWDNLMDVFVRDYSFGSSRGLPSFENEVRLRKPLKTSRP